MINNETASAPATTTSRGSGDLVPPALAQIFSLADNAINLPLLLKQLKTRVGVVPFVGAGMSVPFGFAVWPKFLEDTTPDATGRQRVVDLLDHGQYTEWTAAAFDLMTGDIRKDDVLGRIVCGSTKHYCAWPRRPGG